MRTLIAIPVYNEEKYVTRVLSEVRKYAREILVIDDGSTDQTPLLLAQQPVDVIRHAQNRGYGRSLIDAFRWASCATCRYDWLITMDCDEQHEPAALPRFFEAIARDDADVISGSRYLTMPGSSASGQRTLSLTGAAISSAPGAAISSAPGVAASNHPAQGVDLSSDSHNTPPADRRAINEQITQLVNQTLSLRLTDTFCGFKAYRVSALRQLSLNEAGYAFPMQFWVQAAANRLRIVEISVRLIYNDPNRSFGGLLDDATIRLNHYRQVFERELSRFPGRFECVCAAK